MDAPIEFLLQHWPGVLFRQTPDQCFTFLGARIEEWTGHPVAALANDPVKFMNCIHEDDVESVRHHLTRAAESGSEFTLHFRFRHAATGRITHVSEARRSVRGPAGEVKFHEGYWQDESPLAHAGHRLESAAWTETLARLTPGYAHDFNNVIAGVHGLSDTFLSQIEPGHPFHDGLALMKRNTQQAAQLVQRLQQLHLPRTGERAYHDLNAIVKDTAEVLARGLNKRLEIATELAPVQLPIHADDAELQQVILALAFNAADAVPTQARNARLLFRTSAHETAPRVGHHAGTLPSAPCVCLSVQDSGLGIKPRHLPQLFAPGFTTKPGHHGLGLGLRHAQSFVASHHGALSVESTEGAGTTFHLWLPRANFTEADPAAVIAPTRPRLVLLAGQPANALQATADALRQRDLRTVIATDDAEELLADPDIAFDALLLCAAKDDPDALRLIQFVHRHRLPLKIILRPAGCADEDLDPQLLAKADRTIASDLPLDRLAEKIFQAITA